MIFPYLSIEVKESVAITIPYPVLLFHIQCYSVITSV